MPEPTGISSVAELLVRLRQGLAPRALRLFAAQGLLPVSREDLIRVLVILVADADPEISDAANATLTTFSNENMLAVLDVPDVEPLEIDLLARCRQDDALWQAIARHPRTANETLRWLARAASAPTQDAIVTNQTRLLGCLEILEDLRENPQVSQDVLRRVREFEEEFLEKATVWATSGPGQGEIPETPSIEEVLAELKALGMNIPGGEIAPRYVPEPEPDAPAEQRDAYLRIGMMNTYQRIMQALVGSGEERMILVRDRSLLVVRAVIQSPKLSDAEREKIAGMRSANEEALRMMSRRPQWLRRYPVLRNLAFNPKTPPGIALQLARRLSMRDLRLISRDHNVPELVRKAAREKLEQSR